MLPLIAALILAPLVAFGAEKPDGDPLAGRFGGFRDDFEAIYGEPKATGEPENVLGATTAVFDHDLFALLGAMYVSKRVVYVKAEFAEGVAVPMDLLAPVIFDFGPDDMDVDTDDFSVLESGGIAFEAFSEAMSEEVSHLVYRRVGADGADPGEFLLVLFGDDDSLEFTGFELRLGSEKTLES